MALVIRTELDKLSNGLDLKFVTGLGVFFGPPKNVLKYHLTRSIKQISVFEALWRQEHWNTEKNDEINLFLYFTHYKINKFFN